MATKIFNPRFLTLVGMLTADEPELDWGVWLTNLLEDQRNHCLAGRERAKDDVAECEDCNLHGPDDDDPDHYCEFHWREINRKCPPVDQLTFERWIVIGAYVTPTGPVEWWLEDMKTAGEVAAFVESVQGTNSLIYKIVDTERGVFMHHLECTELWCPDGEPDMRVDTHQALRHRDTDMLDYAPGDPGYEDHPPIIHQEGA